MIYLMYCYTLTAESWTFFHFLKFFLVYDIVNNEVCFESAIQFTSKNAQPILIKSLQTTSS